MAKFPELMNELATIKNEAITLTSEISKNDDNIMKMVYESVDNLECSSDVCRNPNREVQIPFSKVYSEDLIYKEHDAVMKKVAEKYNGYKESFEESSKKVIDLIYSCRQKMKGLLAPVDDIKNETDKAYINFKDALNTLAQPLTNVVEGVEVNEFRKKDFKDQNVLNKLKELLERLKENFEKYNNSLKGFNTKTLDLFQTVTKTDNTFSNFIEVKMLEKIKGIPSLLNEGINLLPDTTRKINGYNKSKKVDEKNQDKNEERAKYYDEMLTKVLKMTKNVDDQIYNSNKGIDSNFDVLNEQVGNVKKIVNQNADSFNQSVQELKEYGKKIIEIVDEIRKLFDLEPVKIVFDDKDIEYPFYEYAKKLDKGFEEIQEIKEEVQKPMKLVMVVFGKQINTVTLDLLFIMDITESMQDLLDETRENIKYILDKIKTDSPGIDVRFAYEGYRDFADLKVGEKYYTIDFETDMEVFKTKLDKIKAIGGGDDAEDVAGGLYAGLNLSWRSNARYAILIADAPGHGDQYHENDVQDDYPEGDPNGHTLEDLMRSYAKKNINLCLTRIDDYTDKMFKAMKGAYEEEAKNSKDQPKIQEVPYDEEEEGNADQNQQKKEKSHIMGNIVAKTAIEIYNQYSKKESIN